MNKIDKAENKLKEFLEKWEEHYRLSKEEVEELLSNNIPKVKEIYIDNITNEDDFIYLKINDKIVYTNKNNNRDDREIYVRV